MVTHMKITVNLHASLSPNSKSRIHLNSPEALLPRATGFLGAQIYISLYWADDPIFFLHAIGQTKEAILYLFLGH